MGNLAAFINNYGLVDILNSSNAVCEEKTNLYFLYTWNSIHFYLFKNENKFLSVYSPFHGRCLEKEELLVFLSSNPAALYNDSENLGELEAGSVSTSKLEPISVNDIRTTSFGLINRQDDGFYVEIGLKPFIYKTGEIGFALSHDGKKSNILLEDGSAIFPSVGGLQFLDNENENVILCTKPSLLNDKLETDFSLLFYYGLTGKNFDPVKEKIGGKQLHLAHSFEKGDFTDGDFGLMLEYFQHQNSPLVAYEVNELEFVLNFDFGAFMPKLETIISVSSNPTLTFNNLVNFLNLLQLYFVFDHNSFSKEKSLPVTAKVDIYEAYERIIKSESQNYMDNKESAPFFNVDYNILKRDSGTLLKLSFRKHQAAFFTVFNFLAFVQDDQFLHLLNVDHETT